MKDSEIRSLPVLATVNFRVAPDGTWHASVFTLRDNAMLSAGDAQSLAQALAYELNEALILTSPTPATPTKTEP